MPTLSFRKLHPHFAAEASAIELRTVTDQPRLDAIRAGMDEYAVLVFRDQPFADTEQLEFAQRFDGVLHAKTGASVVKKSRFGNEALTDISNLDEGGAILAAADRRRAYSLGNRLWHTDASFRIRRGATRCCRPRSCRPWPPTPSSRICARRTTVSTRT